MVMNVFKAHYTDNAAATVLIGHTGVIKFLQNVHLKNIS